MLRGRQLDELDVKDLGDIVTRMPPTVQKSATIEDALNAMLSDPRSGKVYVIDVEGNLVGVVTGLSILDALGEHTLDQRGGPKSSAHLTRSILSESVERLIKKPKPVKLSTPLKEALSIIVAEQIADLPVVDDDYKLIGELIGLGMLESLKSA
jgi:CBS domain-containing protein